MNITEKRLTKFKKTVANRQFDFTVVLEHLTDGHNIGAVLRSCEAIGIKSVFIIPHPDPKWRRNFVMGKRTTAGARKWLDVFTFTDVQSCIDYLRLNGFQIFSTAIGPKAKSVYEMDFCNKIAVILGNEKVGVSEKALELSDGNIIIPMQGMMQSLNVSVACSVILFEAMRQRSISGKYIDKNDQTEIEERLQNSPERQELLQEFLKRHQNRYRGSNTKSLDDL